MSTNAATTTSSAPLRKTAQVVSLVFLLVGILGFVPGITTNFGDLTFAGHHSDALLLGLFQVSVLHNIVHLLFGVVGLVLARTANGAYAYLLGGGIIYLVLWIYGLLIDRDSGANFVPLNTADNWLHFLLGLGMIFLGIVLGRSRHAATERPATARRS
ncbi:MAG TPA: DUF4383 domain-containing protein [Kribbella sp.]